MSQPSTSTTTPTKLILIGEHSVLRGKKGIVIPVMDFRTTCSVMKKLTPGLRVTPRVRLGGRSQDPKQQNNENIIVPPSWTKSLQKHTKKIADTTEFHLSTQAHIGSGMGVSASGSVAFVRAWFQHFEIKLPKHLLYTLVDQIESINHGTASGIDAAAIIEEQVLVFQRTKKHIVHTPLDIDISTHPLLTQIKIHHTGTPQESTAEMVEWVTKQEKMNPEQYTKYWEELDRLSGKIEKLLLEIKNVSAVILDDLHLKNNSKLNQFRNLINQAGLILESVGIVSEETKKLSKSLRSQGKGVKVSGAGGRSQGSGVLIVI